jgi:hypothetical protein
MKLHEIEGLSPTSRRRLLKWLGLGAATPALRYALGEVVVGRAFAEEQAQKPEPTYFIELGLRDQWDPGHVFVAPGLATNPSINRGEKGQNAALYFTQDELKRHPNDVYLTGDSAILAPHVDSIAFVDCCEVAKGSIHGHESANPMRSPGRNHTKKPGMIEMYSNDPTTKFPGGNERYYSSTPTPASLHNFVQKKIGEDVRNGLALKNISRSIHTVYHFGAGLPGAELDRIRTKTQLMETFPSGPNAETLLNALAGPEEAEAYRRVLETLDRRFFDRRKLVESAWTDHVSNLGEAQKGMWSPPRPITLTLPLSAEEEAYWSAGVPRQVGGRPQYQIWEAAAYAAKILTNGITRTVALEFDYVDVHGSRPEKQMRTMATQLALPLGRLIETLKAAGIYDRTLIAVFCVDGGRPPAAGDSGDRGKNTVVLAGGAVKGGYYGDIRATPTATGNTYSYHAPDLETGLPGPGASKNDLRVPGAAIWRTIMKALRVPDEICERFPDVAGTKPLSFMLRG